MTLKLYYARSSGSLSARILIHELNLSCEFIAVNQKTHMTANDEDLLTINPKNRLPVLITEDNQVLTESQVIQQYLIDHYGLQYNMIDLLPPPNNDLKRYKILEWVSFIRVDLHNLYFLLLNPDIPEDLKENIFKPMFKEKLKYPNQVLETKQYLTGNDFTIADIHMFVILVWLKDIKINITEFSNLDKYFLFLKQRPSIKQSLQEKNML